jgi:hypothetical protein
LASTQPVVVFSLQVDQHTNRVVIEWRDRASGLVIAEIPGKTVVKAIEESNVPAPSSEHINLQICGLSPLIGRATAHRDDIASPEYLEQSTPIFLLEVRKGSED